jgi:hypothetical protein
VAERLYLRGHVHEIRPDRGGHFARRAYRSPHHFRFLFINARNWRRCSSGTRTTRRESD